MKKSSVRVALAALAGVLFFVGYIGFGQLYLTWFCVVPALIAVRGLRGKKVFGLGMIFGTVTCLGGYYWVVYLIEDFTPLGVWGGVAGCFLLCVWEAGICTFVLMCSRRAEDRLGIAPVWTIAVTMPAIELIYPLIFPYFIGYSQYRFIYITQIVELTGMAGLTVVIMLVNGAFYELLVARLEGRSVVRRRVAVPLAVFALTLAYGLVRVPMVDKDQAAAEQMRVAVVQTNLGARDKRKHRDEFIRRHVDMSMEAVRDDSEIDLVVWPESAYNRYIGRDRESVSNVVGRIGRPVIFGTLTAERIENSQEGERTHRTYNSAVLASKDGRILGMFDKIKLLAFGETIPFVETLPFLAKLFPHGGLFTVGKTYAHLTMEDGTKLLPMICYEDIIPSIPRAIWAASGPADVLVNVTNDSWYGDSHEPIIHFGMASFRAIEARRALVRSTNTGISGFVDPAGRVIGLSGQWTRETMVRDIPVIRDGSTSVYMRFGDWIGLLLWALIAWAFIVDRKRSEPELADASPDDVPEPSASKPGKPKKASKKSRRRKR